MGRVEPGAGVGDHPQGDGDGHALLLLRGAEDGAQRLAVDVLHRDVEDILLVAEVEDLDHIGVVDLRGDAGLVHEHLLELRVIAQGREHHLDRQGFLETPGALHAGGPDGRHAPLSDGDEEFVAPYGLAWLDLA